MYVFGVGVVVFVNDLVVYWYFIGYVGGYVEFEYFIVVVGYGKVGGWYEFVGWGFL